MEKVAAPKVLWHVVLISFRPETPEEVRESVYECYQTLAEKCGGREAGIVSFTVERNLDLRKGIHLVELAVFRDDAAFQAFRAHPEHTKITDVLRDVADWQVGDFVHPHMP